MAHLAHQAIPFFQTTLTVFERSWEYAPDAEHEGENVPTDSADIEIIGVLQPMPPALLQSLPEAQRIGIAYLLHTQEDLTINESISTYMRLNGFEYKLVEFQNWSQWQIWRYGLQITESAQGR